MAVQVVGVVGAEAAKFTAETEGRAREAIRRVLREQRARIVVSGACHLGGIDVWAIEEGRAMGLACVEFPPEKLQWEPSGYKERNELIAKTSNHVICIAVRELPPMYRGMRFTHCYHCGRSDHVKSGGCWTMLYAKRRLRKTTELIII